MIQPILKFLKDEKLVEIKKGSGISEGVYTYALTDEGRVRSREVIELSAYAGVSVRSLTASSREPSTSVPSVEPRSGSTACSGCGMRPITFPSALTTPAISATEPFGLSPS